MHDRGEDEPMASTTTNPDLTTIPPGGVPPLRHGDRLSREEFECRYDAMPELKKAELIDGVVHLPSPVRRERGTPHFNLITWLGVYAGYTPGIEGSDNGSLRVGDASMPQPDAFLRIDEALGGQSRAGEDGYVAGTPELIAEVAVSSASFDLNVKLPFYASHGAREYLVWRVRDQVVDWFLFDGMQCERIVPTEQGWYRSRTLPGLWLDPAALMRWDIPGLLAALQQGLASPEHAEFVKLLQERAARQP
jgi:Uma2 family endonuclease